MSGEDVDQRVKLLYLLHLGEIAVEQLRGATEGRVLIGGLGMGFTLKSVLAGVGKNIAVEAVELIPEVVEWNRTFMKDLNGKLLDDPRVTVVTRDVYALLNRSKPNTYDAILLDPLELEASSRRR